MKVEVNGISIYFECYYDNQLLKNIASIKALGSEFFLIPISGGPGMNHSVFKPQLTKLSSCTPVLFIDLRGTGKSQHGDATFWTTKQQAEDVIALCEALGVSSAVFYSHSAGATVLADIAVKNITLVKAALVAAPIILPISYFVEYVFKTQSHALSEIARQLWEDQNVEIVPTYMEKIFPLYDPVSRDSAPTSDININVELFFAMLDQHFYQDATLRFAGLKTDVSILLGAMDPFGLPNDSVPKLLNNGFKHEQIKIFEHSGHDALLCEPDKVLEHIRYFLEKQFYLP